MKSSPGNKINKNEYIPLSEKLVFLNSISLTLRPLSRISCAFSPLMVTYPAIFSFLLIPKLLIVYEALEKTGFYPVKSSNTFSAFVNLSPDSPTQQLITNFLILISFMQFSFFYWTYYFPPFYYLVAILIYYFLFWFWFFFCQKIYLFFIFNFGLRG